MYAVSRTKLEACQGSAPDKRYLAASGVHASSRHTRAPWKHARLAAALD